VHCHCHGVAGEEFAQGRFDGSYTRLGSLRSYAERRVGTLPQQTGFTRRRCPPEDNREDAAAAPAIRRPPGGWSLADLYRFSKVFH
jgi:hypothetical protein